MRRLITNAQDTFRVKAYAGTNGVLLAFDLAEERKPGFLGFAIEQKESGKPWQWLLNNLTFPGKAHTLPKWNATPSNLAPIQKFRWADYSIEPGTTCKYRVHPFYSNLPGTGEALEIEVTTATVSLKTIMSASIVPLPPVRRLDAGFLRWMDCFSRTRICPLKNGRLSRAIAWKMVC